MSSLRNFRGDSRRSAKNIAQDLSEDVAAGHLRRIGTGRRRTRLSARHGGLEPGPPPIMTGFMRASRIPFSNSRKIWPRRSPPGPVRQCPSKHGMGWPLALPGDEPELGSPRPKICPKMSPSPPLSVGGPGCAGDAAFPDPLRVSPETRIPARIGSICLSTLEVTPEKCCPCRRPRG